MIVSNFHCKLCAAYSILSYDMMADRMMKAAKAAFDVSVDSGITFFDTAEVYGSKVINSNDQCFLCLLI